MSDRSRRTFLRSMGAVGALGALAGCNINESSGTTPASADVIVGPNTRPRFKPGTLTVSAGDTVEWYFAAASHNVSGVPEHHEKVNLPDGADPFASYGVDGNPGKTEPSGATYTHTFETPGTYTYVCIPHVNVGMIGEITVEE